MKTVSRGIRFLLLGSSALAVSCNRDTRIGSGHLLMEINDELQVRVNSSYPGASQLMDGFSSSERLVTKYFTAGDFSLTHKEQKKIHDQAGAGSEWILYGKNNRYGVEKILHIKTYKDFPDAAYLRVAYVNHGTRDLPVIRWVNNQYTLLPSPDSVRFWSFQGSSHEDRRDWIQPVTPGFEQENFMGMNASDYGGGIPVVDLWRRDAGLAVGITEPVARLVALPVDYDKYAAGATVGVSFDYPREKLLRPGDTLRTFESFVSVHQKDCFRTLREFSEYMKTKGIRSAPPEPAAFEPVWCAWGYERDFSVSEILRTLPKVKSLGIKWVGIDDGYQQNEGDWHTNHTHFPSGDQGMKALVDSIHAMGMKAVLWWAPLAVDPDSKFLKEHPDILLRQKNGAPEYITWWNSFYMAPTDSTVLQEAKNTVKLFMEDWGFDALKLDGQHMNACAPDYADGHRLAYPEQSYELLPQYFKTIFETARSIRPDAVIEFCPCGECMNFYTMPYTNQFVASDPVSSWQVRLKGMVYKALMPQTAYFGDHVELTDNGEDFASQIGVGAVPGTKFVWPATGVASKDKNLLTPGKDSLFGKWIALYHREMLSTGTYLGDLYDIGYDRPEAHCIRKGRNMFYAFYAPRFKGTLELRGLNKDMHYRVRDYFHNRSLGEIAGNAPRVSTDFTQFLVLEVSPVITP